MEQDCIGAQQLLTKRQENEHSSTAGLCDNHDIMQHERMN